MENLEEGPRVTRSLRKRLTSVDSEASSRPGTPSALKPINACMTELNSPSRTARMTRRNSVTGTQTPAKTPAKARGTTAATLSAAATRLDTPDLNSPARRTTRKRSVTLVDDEPVTPRVTISKLKYETLAEEESTPVIERRVTRSSSKSPLQLEKQKQETAAHSSPVESLSPKSKPSTTQPTDSAASARRRSSKPGPKSKTKSPVIDDDLSDVEVINLEAEDDESNAQKPNEIIEIDLDETSEAGSEIYKTKSKVADVTCLPNENQDESFGECVLIADVETLHKIKENKLSDETLDATQKTVENLCKKSPTKSSPTVTNTAEKSTRKSLENIAKSSIKATEKSTPSKTPEKLLKSVENSIKSPEKSTKSPEKSTKSPEKSTKSPEKSTKSPEKSAKSSEVLNAKSSIKSPEKITKSTEKSEEIAKSSAKLENNTTENLSDKSPVKSKENSTEKSAEKSFTKSLEHFEEKTIKSPEKSKEPVEGNSSTKSPETSSAKLEEPSTKSSTNALASFGIFSNQSQKDSMESNKVIVDSDAATKTPIEFRPKPIITAVVELDPLTPTALEKIIHGKQSKTDKSEAPKARQDDVADNGANVKADDEVAKKAKPESIKFVAFTESPEDNKHKSSYPKTPGLTKSKSYIEINSSHEDEKDGSFQAENKSRASINKSSSNRMDEDAAVADENENDEEDDNDVEMMDLDNNLRLESITPYKSKQLQMLQSSTPLLNTGNAPKKSGLTPKVLERAQSSKEELAADAEVTTTSVAKPAKDSLTVALEEASAKEQPPSPLMKPWSLSVSGKKSDEAALDAIKPEQTLATAVEIREFPSAKKRNSRFESDDDEAVSDDADIAEEHSEEGEEEEQDEQAIILHDDEGEEELADDEKPRRKNYFVSDEAMEADADYESGDSMDSEERRELKENEIPIDGESIGSEDTDHGDDDGEAYGDEEEEEDENGSFIVKDSEESLLELTDDEENVDESDKKKYRRILRVQSDSEEENEQQEEEDKTNNKENAEVNELALEVSRMIDETGILEELEEDEKEAFKNVKKDEAVKLNDSKRQSRRSIVEKAKTEQPDEKDETVALNDSKRQTRKSLKEKEIAEEAAKSMQVELNDSKRQTRNSMREKPKTEEDLNSCKEMDKLIVNDDEEDEYEDEENKDKEEADEDVDDEQLIAIKSADSNLNNSKLSETAKEIQKIAGNESSVEDDEDDDEAAKRALNASRKESIKKLNQSDRFNKTVHELNDETSPEVVEIIKDASILRRKSLNQSKPAVASSSSSEEDDEVALQKLVSAGKRKKQMMSASSSDESAEEEQAEHLKQTLKYETDEDTSEPEEKLVTKQAAKRKSMPAIKRKEEAAVITTLRRKSMSHLRNDMMPMSPLGDGTTSESETDKEETATSLRKKSGGLSVSFTNFMQKKQVRETATGKFMHNSFSIGVSVTKKTVSSSEQQSDSAMSSTSGQDVQANDDEDKQDYDNEQRENKTSEEEAPSNDEEDAAIDAEEDEVTSNSSNSNSDPQFSSDDAEQLNKLQHMEKPSTYGEYRRQSLIHQATGSGTADDLNKSGAKLKRRRSMCVAQDGAAFNPSQSFMENVAKQRRQQRSLENQAATKRKRLSKSFCAGSLDSTQLEEVRHMHKKSRIMRHNSSNTVKSSTPREPKTKIQNDDNNNIQRILGRCDQILEAANRAKLEAKLNYNKSKVRVAKPKKAKKPVAVTETSSDNNTQEEQQQILDLKKQLKRKEKAKLELERALKASAEIILHKSAKQTKLEAQLKPTIEKSQMSNDSNEELAPPVPKKKKSKESIPKTEHHEKVHHVHKHHSAAGEILEVPLKHKKKKRTTEIELSTGIVRVEPVTPTKHIKRNGFRESPLTPQAHGFKMRHIHGDAAATASDEDVPRRHKRKREFEEHRQAAEPKHQWTQSGEFIEEDLRPQHHGTRGGSTQFLVSALNGARKAKKSLALGGVGGASVSAAGMSNNGALAFKNNALYRANIPRESSRDLMHRKERKHVHSHF